MATYLLRLIVICITLICLGSLAIYPLFSFDTEYPIRYTLKSQGDTPSMRCDYGHTQIQSRVQIPLLVPRRFHPYSLKSLT